MPTDSRDALLRIMDYQRMPLSLVQHAVGDAGAASQILPESNVNTDRETDQTATNTIIDASIKDQIHADTAEQDSLEPGWDWTLRSDGFDATHLHDQLPISDIAFTQPLSHDTEDLPSSSIAVDIDTPKDSTEELVDKLSERVGSLQIGPEGHVRYYGPTSNFNLVKMPTMDAPSAHLSAKSEAADCFRKLGLDKSVPSDLQDHLINLYFTWHDPALHVVDRTIFESARITSSQNKTATFYSEALSNAM